MGTTGGLHLQLSKAAEQQRSWTFESCSTLYMAVHYETCSCVPLYLICNSDAVCLFSAPFQTCPFPVSAKSSHALHLHNGSHPDRVTPSRLSSPLAVSCLSLRSLPSLSCSLVAYWLFSHLTVLVSSIGTPVSQFLNPLLLLSSTPQSLLPCVTISWSFLSKTGNQLLSQSSQITPFPVLLEIVNTLREASAHPKRLEKALSGKAISVTHTIGWSIHSHSGRMQYCWH